jgi:hypothetical protein
MSIRTLLTNLRQHGADLDFAKILVPTLKHWYAYQMVYPWSLFFVKASILALYHRIFTQTKFRYSVYVVSAFVTTYTIVVFFVNVWHSSESNHTLLTVAGFRVQDLSFQSVGANISSGVQ